MGYNTDFRGYFNFDRPVEPWLEEYINKFCNTRRMKRNPEKIKELFANWDKQCFNGELGPDGAYFIGGKGFFGQDNDESVINQNTPPNGQPELWCQWIIEGDKLVWDGNEKFYSYIEWLEYLIAHFFAPLGYVLNGTVDWRGEEWGDCGYICVKDNNVNVMYGGY